MGLLDRGGEHRKKKTRILAHASNDYAAVAVVRCSEHCAHHDRGNE